MRKFYGLSLIILFYSSFGAAAEPQAAIHAACKKQYPATSQSAQYNQCMVIGLEPIVEKGEGTFRTVVSLAQSLTEIKQFDKATHWYKQVLQRKDLSPFDRELVESYLLNIPVEKIKDTCENQYEPLRQNQLYSQCVVKDLTPLAEKGHFVATLLLANTLSDLQQYDSAIYWHQFLLKNKSLSSVQRALVERSLQATRAMKEMPTFNPEPVTPNSPPPVDSLPPTDSPPPANPQESPDSAVFN